MKRYNAYTEDYGIRFKADVEEHPEGEYVDAETAQELYDNLLAFIEAVEDDTIRVRPSNREVLLDILARSNDAIYKADKD